MVGALTALEGSYALAMISHPRPERIFCARHESPLIIGVGSESNYVGSDFNAFIDYTKNTVILDDGEYGIVSKDSYSVKSLRSGEVVDKSIIVVPWDSELSRKGGYPHYMLKEIHEQPQAVRSALGDRRRRDQRPGRHDGGGAARAPARRRHDVLRRAARAVPAGGARPTSTCRR